MTLKKETHEQASIEPLDGTQSSDGCDLTLIRWMLSLSPMERLEVLQASAGSLARLRDVARCPSPTLHLHHH